MGDSTRALISWAACSAEIFKLRERVTALEADSHPPIDLGSAIDEILQARGYHQAGVCLPEKQTAPAAAEDLLRACRVMLQLDLDETLVGSGLIVDINKIPDIETIDNRHAYRRARALSALLVGIDKTLGTHIGGVADV